MFILLKLLNPMLGIRIVLRHHDLLRQLLMRLAARKGSALGPIWSSPIRL
ncbi:MAG: hypothetical protein ACLSB9_31125 [Hydrogeniiclostridium mannosilyticum]